MRKLAALIALIAIFSTFAVVPAFADASCPGSLPNQLVVGGRGQIAQTFSTLRYTPGGTPIQIVYAPAQFNVLAGPSSDGFLCYYQIQYDDGMKGWANESELVSIYGNNQYWLTPINGQPPPPPTSGTYCPGSLATRLTVGSQGSIAQTFSTLRDVPGGNTIKVVFAPATFTVLAGPASDGYLCYFQIDYGNGQTGWAAESQIWSIWGFDQYWLAPSNNAG
jgi:hypothetical protein